MSNCIDYTDNEINIRKVNEFYKETCLRIWKNGIDNRFIADSEKFSELLWDAYTSPTTETFVILNKDFDVCGVCHLDHTDRINPEISINIDEAYQRKGLGYKAVKLMLKSTQSICNAEYYVWKCFDDNLASQKLAEKLNGKLVRKQPCFSQALIEKGKKYGIYKSDDEIPLTYEYHIKLEDI